MVPQVNYNAIPIKARSEIAMLRAAGGISSQILELMAPHVQPGVTKKAAQQNST
jgi:methionine aminopeptidase